VPGTRNVYTIGGPDETVHVALDPQRLAGYGLTVTELIAAERKATPDEVGYYRLRPPVKPITLAELASLPISEAERKAVER